MNKIKAAIIEDEIPAARLLRDTLLSLRPGWDVQLLPGNIEEAVEWFAQHPHPDILFLDIFAMRAQTANAKTQVELAQYKYMHSSRSVS